MYKTIFTNWAFMRWLRLLIGILALVQALVYKDISIALVGILLLVMALANVGCCGASCVVNAPVRKEEKEIIYEELDTKK